MTTKQKLTPKYWVCHDIATGDIYPSTMYKSMRDSIRAFCDNESYARWGLVNDEGVYEEFLGDGNLDCSLVEVRLVESKEE
jgi:hypothetical protein